MEPTEYTEVEFTEQAGTGPCFSLWSEPGPDGEGWIHELPLQALADRMELFGLTEPEETLDVLTELAREPGAADEIYESLHEAYGEVVRMEAYALYAGGGLNRQTAGAQTVLAVGLVSEDRRRRLEDVRREALDRLGLGAGAVRAAMSEEGEEEPFALRPSPEVKERICEIVRRHSKEIEDYRMMTAMSFVGPSLENGGPESE
ncbi:hypothetical protein ACFYOC_14860 [Nocardiopsis alba]|uniref:Uncharacterized protein n=1 Tax=Nocardiopsis alba (strain ATCC BAA-2165 / BE74) TaxID=1205910 RepID=J7L980_NOCAA|nr:hypothetical protein [Nocardiopsis alba]AFR10213.1 hypothetical protein B005_2763 [Nocardiopsis alba ATCC BAA-2165]